MWGRGQGEGVVTASKKAERKSLELNRSRARTMRRAPVSTEKLFWSEVRDRKLDGFKFKRQVLIGPYIADFVCVEKNLIVEFDGPLHDEAYDAKRDAFLEREGYRVMRFSNDEAGSDFATVLLSIREALRTPSPNPHMRGGEDYEREPRPRKSGEG
jgi:very-short-patch-repair endonuclease